MREGTEDLKNPFSVYAINWPTLEIYWATWSQWRKLVFKESIVRDGMDWAQVEAALNLSGIKRSQRPMIFEGLRKIETAVLEHLNRD